METLTIADTYFLKAYDSYDYNLEEVVENIGYALSYDEEHAPTWCLKGRLMMDCMKNFNEARHCFENALFYDTNYIDTYKYYSLLLIWISDFEKAQIVINKSKRVKGMSRATIIHRSAMIHEYQGRIGEAIRIMKNGKLFSLTQSNYDFFKEEIDRLNRKVSKPVKRKVPKIPKAVRPTLFQLAGKLIMRLL
ncbi:MAG: hypothetical protein AAGA77_13300 [Bacteroidota bacterium]